MLSGRDSPDDVACWSYQRRLSPSVPARSYMTTVLTPHTEHCLVWLGGPFRPSLGVATVMFFISLEQVKITNICRALSSLLRTILLAVSVGICKDVRCTCGDEPKKHIKFINRWRRITNQISTKVREMAWEWGMCWLMSSYEFLVTGVSRDSQPHKGWLMTAITINEPDTLSKLI